MGQPEVGGYGLAPTRDSVYQRANFNDLFYTRKLISSHSYMLVLSAPLSVTKNLICPLEICSKVLKSGM